MFKMALHLALHCLSSCPSKRTRHVFSEVQVLLPQLLWCTGRKQEMTTPHHSKSNIHKSDTVFPGGSLCTSKEPQTAVILIGKIHPAGSYPGQKPNNNPNIIFNKLAEP